MGARNPATIPISQRRDTFETVEKMRAGGWDVISHCRTCDLMMQVDLELMIARLGTGVSLWNRKSRCRRIGCPGWVEFEAKPPRVPFYSVLRAPD